MSNSKLVMSQAANSWEGPTYIEDVFSTYLYTGTGASQTITNGIDLAGEGGMVWTKRRSALYSHSVFDTNRGTSPGKLLSTNAANAEQTDTNVLTSYNSNGYSLGSNVYNNASSATFVSWTFRKAPRFFDVVTYTGTGVAGHTINHNLGVTPACIIIKVTSTSNDWVVYHKDHPLNNTSTSTQYYMRLNQTNASYNAGSLVFDNISDTSFDLGTLTLVNGVGQSYVAYLFAHDPLGPSGDGSDGLIACGSYTGTGVDNNAINIGWEPQWLLWKPASTTGDWQLVDNMRGFTAAGVGVNRLEPNTSDAEAVSGSPYCDISATGFVQGGSSSSNNASGATYIYIAIRRGPMREPTSGTEVFAVHEPANSARSATIPFFEAGFPPDAAIDRFNKNGSFGARFSSRLTGANYLFTDKTDAEASNAYHDYNTYMTGYYTNLGTAQGGDDVAWMFRRAPGFFDVVAYTGDGVAGRTVSHNLGVAPELMIVKTRSSLDSWYVYHTGLGTGGRRLNSTSNLNTGRWNGTHPTESIFTLSSSGTNVSGDNYIAYLFATLPGVSKVGSYTGNGSSQTIDCGFTSGTRFILIRRIDADGDWYVWDTARGIVSGNDPHLSLNTTAAEVTTNDSIDPDSSGFIVNQLAATNINVSSASYIYLAIA